MKINSNTISLEKENYTKLEAIIKKIASENKIENVKEVLVSLSKDNGIIKFGILNPDTIDSYNTPEEDTSRFKELESRIDAINKKRDEITKERLLKDPKMEVEPKSSWKLYKDDSKDGFPYKIEQLSDFPDDDSSEMESWYEQFPSLDEAEKYISFLEKTVKLREAEPDDMINYY